MDGLSGEAVEVVVVEKHWERSKSGPDALLVFLSNGRDFTLKQNADGTFVGVFERETQIPWGFESALTGLSPKTLRQLADEIDARERAS